MYINYFYCTILRSEKGTYTINDSCTETCKRILVHYGLWAEILKSVFLQIYTAINIMKLTYIFYYGQKHVKYQYAINIIHDLSTRQRKRIRIDK